jgi:hypothetical protein
MSDKTSDTQSIHQIEPLHGSENYAPWKVQILDVLTDLGLDDHVDPDSVVPDESDAKKLAAWKKADRRTLSAIRLRVSPDVVQHIQGETKALSAWEMLSHLFELKGQMGIVLARHKFYSIRAPADQPLEPHIKLMRRFQGELTSLGQKVTDGDFTVALLSSLPADWDAFIRSTLSGSTAPDSKTTISTILTEERRRNDRDGENDRAMIASHRHHPKFCSTPNSPAPTSFPTPTTSSASRKNAVCHKCGGKGHIARVCPSQRDDEPDKANFVYDVEDEAETDYAF